MRYALIPLLAILALTACSASPPPDGTVMLGLRECVLGRDGGETNVLGADITRRLPPFREKISAPTIAYMATVFPVEVEVAYRDGFTNPYRIDFFEHRPSGQWYASWGNAWRKLPRK